MLLLPSAVQGEGDAVKVEVLLLAGPGTKLMLAERLSDAKLAVRVLVSALVDFTVMTTAPLALVVPVLADRLLLVPVLAKLTATPEMTLL